MKNSDLTSISAFSTHISCMIRSTIQRVSKFQTHLPSARFQRKKWFPAD